MGTKRGGSSGPGSGSSDGVNWGFIYGRICTVLKKLPSEVDGMYLWEVTELFDYWTDHPPEHELMAAQIGFKAAPKEGSAEKEQDFAAFYAETMAI